MDENSDREGEMDFDKADFGGDESSLICARCSRPIHDAYFDINGQTTCEACRYEVENDRTRGSSFGRLLRSVLAGGFAGVIGAGIYYAVVALTGYEVGLVAIVVGYIVGVAVRWGSGGSGGRAYQALAVAITYFAIVSTYVPFIIEGMGEMEQAESAISDGESKTAPQGSDELSTGASPENAVGQEESNGVIEEELSTSEVAFALALFALFVLASPFLAGFENIIGILIIGFALYQAWKLNEYRPLAVAGPFKVGHSGAAGPSPKFSNLG